MSVRPSDPFSIGSVRLRNRIFVSGHTTNFGEANLPTARHADYHSRRARGGVGLIITEAIRVHPTSAGRESTLGAFGDDCIPAFAAVVEAVHAEGAAIFAQLEHSGRHANGNANRTTAWAPSAIPWTLGAAVPHEMSTSDIARLVSAFASGARRMVAAGFDGLEIHLGHGHLLAQFLSPLSNRRTDAYGGDLVSRMRIVVEVLGAVYTNVPSTMPVGVRVSAEEFLDGGLGPDNVIEIVQVLRKQFPLAFVHVSHSTYVGSYSLSTQMADATFPTMPFRSYPARFKAAMPDLPVFAICRVDNIATAASVLEEGEADMVGLTRAHIADPDLVSKWDVGSDTQRSCIACNQGCIGRVELNLPMSCVVNPEAGLEGRWARWRREYGQRSESKARVLVVGSGPAGLRAAVSAAGRGHEVTLAEAHTHTGGQLGRYAAQLDGRSRFRLATDELLRDARALGVTIRTSWAVSAEDVLDDSWDTVIVATGSTPLPAQLSGAINTWQALDEPDLVGGNVVVVDTLGTWAGAGLAVHLASNRPITHLVVPSAGLAWNVTTYSRLGLVDRLGKAGVNVHLLRRPLSWEGRMLRLADTVTGNIEELADIDTVVEAAPNQAVSQLADELVAVGYPGRLLIIGDALAPRSSLEAIYEGHLAGSVAGGEPTPILTTDPNPSLQILPATALTEEISA